MATTRLVKITTAAPVVTTLTLLDGATDTGYNVLADTTWGDATWEHVDAGIRGTQGRVAANGYPVERAVRLAVRCVGATKDDVDQRVALLDQAADELRQYGGLITVRENGSSRRVHLDVLRVGAVTTGSRNDATFRRDVAIDLVCGPFLYGDPMDTIETWRTDTVTAGEWTIDEGALTRAGGGDCLLSGQTRLRLTGPAYACGDCEVVVKTTTPNPTTGISAMACICADTSGADTMLGAELTASALRVVKREGGVATTLATTATTPTASTTYWLGVRREGGKVVAELYTVQPVMGVDTPSVTVTATLTAAEQAKFVRGHAAVRLNATSAAVAIGDVRVRPYTYVGALTPTNLPLGGAIPGTAPALFDLHISAGASSGSGSSGTVAKSYPVYPLAGWGVTLPTNRATLFGEVGYAAGVNALLGTVTNVITASSTISDSTTARYGRLSVQCATAGGASSQGVAQRVFAEYRQGRVVCALAWMRAASGTPSVFLRLRASASSDGADSGTAALSTSSWTLFSCAWTPTADRQDVFVAGVVSGSTAATFLVDGVCVWECDPASLAGAVSSGTVGARETITVTATPDTVVAPCLALIDSELVQVESISGTSWTVVRGREGTSAASHSSGAIVYALPPLRDHYEGDGAPPPLGVLHAANAVRGGNVTADADYASGWGVVIGSVSNLGWVAVDPGALAADSYTNSVEVDVYARLDILTTTTGPFTFGAFPLAASSAAQIMPGTPSQKQVVLPTTSKSERFSYIGALSFPRAPAVWGIYLYSDTIGTGCDYFLLVPRRANVRGPEAKALGTSYPEAFLSDASWRYRVWESDGSGSLVQPGKPDARYPYHGIGGSPLEMAPGPNTLVVKLSNHVPDDPTVGTGADYKRIAAAVHVAVVPRYLTVRDA